MATTLVPTRTVEDVTVLTVELLAGLLHEDPVQLTANLTARGAQMPVDSLDMFDVLQEFRDRTGLTLPVRKLKRNTLRSVRAFAEFAVAEGTP